MISEELRKYIDMVIQEGENDQLFEMANIHSNIHGIDNVVIWVGRANIRHGLRVKVSNVKNKFDDSNNFVIQMPTLDYDPSQVAKWIDSKTLAKIKEWIKLNQPLLYSYENGEIDDTYKFLNSVSKV
jgi:hypothetical protein